MIKRISAVAIAFVLLLEQSGFSQCIVPGQLPMPAYLSACVPAVDRFRPAYLRSTAFVSGGNGYRFMLDPGDMAFRDGEDRAGAAEKLMEYFYIGLRLPNSSFWVNLRPDAPDSMIDPLLERTDIGRVLLAADVQLKKDMARLTDPDTVPGKTYWDRLYAKADELYKGEDVEIPSAIRPWIVPGEIVIGVSGSGVYIHKATLSVCLEQDWLDHHNLVGCPEGQPTRLSFPASEPDPRIKQLNAYSAQLIRELLIPQLIREVNASKQYAGLRQVYFSLILAQWVKKQRLADSGERAGMSPEIDSGNLTGLESEQPWSKDVYFQEYERSFEQGEYRKQRSVPDRDGITIRQYFSGGVVFETGPASILETARATAFLERPGMLWFDGGRASAENGAAFDHGVSRMDQPDARGAAFVPRDGGEKEDAVEPLSVRIDRLLQRYEQDRENADLIYELARLYKDDRQFDMAEEFAGKLIDPDAAFNVPPLARARGHRISAVVALHRQDYGSVYEHVDAILEYGVMNSRLVRQLRWVLGSMDDDRKYDYAVRLNQWMIENYPDKRRVIAEQSVLLENLGRYEEALQVIEAALHDANSDPVMHLRRNDLLVSLGRESEVSLDFLGQIRLKQDARRMGRVFTYLYEAQRYEESLEVITELLRWEPQSKLTHSQRIVNLIVLKRYPDALAAIENAVSMLGEEAYDRHMQLYRIKALIGVNRLDEAVAAADRYLEVFPLAADVYGLRISLLIFMGRIDGAVRDMVRDLAEMQDHKWVGRSIEYLLDLNRHGQALEVVRVMRHLYPENSEYMEWEIECLAKLGDFVQARGLDAAWSESAVYYPWKKKQRLSNLILRGELMQKYFLEGSASMVDWWKTNLTMSSGALSARLIRHARFPRPQGPLYVADWEELLDHVIGKHEFLGSKKPRYSVDEYDELDPEKGVYSSYFPMSLTREQIAAWVREGFRSAVSLRDLPEGATLDWWLGDYYVSYFHPPEDPGGEVVRMVYVVQRNGRIATVFPTFGPGVFYAFERELQPDGANSLNPYQGMVWNKRSGLPVYVLASGMRAVMRDERLRALSYVEREQLVWLSAVEGELAGEDTGFLYFRYEIPFEEWRERIPGGFVVAKVDKTSRSFTGMADYLPGPFLLDEIRSSARDGGEDDAGPVSDREYLEGLMQQYAQDPADALTMALISRYYRKQQQWNEAVAWAKKAIETGGVPEALGRAYRTMVLEAESRADHRAVAGYVDRLLQVPGIDFTSLFKVWREIGRSPEKIMVQCAAKLQQRLLTLQPANAKEFSNQYIFFKKLRMLKEARKAVDDGLRLERIPALLQQSFAWYFDQKMYQEALQAVGELISVSPLDNRVRSQKIEVLIRIGRYTDALAEIESLKEDLGDAAYDSHVNRQHYRVLMALNQYTEAARVSVDFMERHADDESVKAGRIVALFLSGDPEAASKMVIDAIDSGKSLNWCYLGVVSILMELNRYADVIALGEAVSRKAPSDPMASEWMCEALIKMGKFDEAMVTLAAFMKAGGKQAYVMKLGRLMNMGKLFQTYQLEGREPARTFAQYAERAASNAKAKVEDEYSKKTYKDGHLERLIKHLEEGEDPAGWKTLQYTFDRSGRNASLAHIFEEHVFSSRAVQKEFSSYFPVDMDEYQVQDLIDRGRLAAVPLRNLPGDGVIGWWPAGQYVAYVTVEGASDPVRMVYVVNGGDSIVTAYPSFGPGIIYAARGNIIPAGTVPLNPYRAPVWNRSSKQPVYVSADGMLSVMRDERLAEFERYYEREQLVWLAVTEGSLVFEDERSFYYEYRVLPAWKKRLPGGVFIARVDKKTQTFAGMADDPRNAPDSAAGVTKRNAPKQARKSSKDGGARPGGIDFRNVRGAAAAIQGRGDFRMVRDLESAREDLVRQLSSGNVPSGMAVRDYYMSCCGRVDGAGHKEEIERLVSDILRAEEEYGISSPGWVKALLTAM